MNALAENPRATIGDNKPPSPLDPAEVQAAIRDQHGELLDRAIMVEKSALAVPDRIDDEDASRKASDIAKAIGKAVSALKTTKKIAMEPYKSASDAAGAVFQILIDRLETLKLEVNAKRQPWLEKKEREERERREAEAARKRAEEEAAIQRQLEAEAKRRAAEEAQRKAEAEAEAARQERDRLLAQAAELKRKQQEAEDAEARRLAKIEADRIAAEALKAKADRDQAELDAMRAAKAAKAAARDEKAAGQEAQSADRQAERHERAAQASPAELSSLRGDLGSISSLNQYWKAEVIDFDRLDKAKLWPFIDRDAISAALFKWMREQPADPKFRQMPGAKMFIETGVRTA